MNSSFLSFSSPVTTPSHNICLLRLHLWSFPISFPARLEESLRQKPDLIITIFLHSSEPCKKMSSSEMVSKCCSTGDMKILRVRKVKKFAQGQKFNKAGANIQIHSSTHRSLGIFFSHIKSQIYFWISQDSRLNEFIPSWLKQLN